MYQPPHFHQSDRESLYRLIEQQPLGLLISSGVHSGLIANPVPFLLRRDPTGQGGDVLLAHVARANPQWQALEAGDDVLVHFFGPDHYISPNWYRSKQETGKVVPTWNYQALQIRGTARVHHDPDWLKAQVSALTDQQEAGRVDAWAVDDAPASFVAQQLRGIVGIEIAITDIAGKLKASQNRTQADREGVETGLSAEDSAEATAMARLVAGGGTG